MCVSCGCGELEEDHGDKRNITMSQLQEAGEAANIDLEEVISNIAKAEAQGQGASSGGGSR